MAYHDDRPDAATRERFKKGLLNANRKQRSETMLTLFRLTAFVDVPDDFEKVVTQTRKTYPPPSNNAGRNRE